MTRMIDTLAERSGTQRVVIAILLGIVGLFLLGMAVGVVVAMIEKGQLPSRLWVTALPFVSAPLGAFSIYAAWRLAAPPASASGYEKRYWRMWLIIIMLGLPVGMVLGAFGATEGLDALNPLSATPISATVAIGLAGMVTLLFVASLTLYHRTIDDHEERAYLWGSQIAYYFLLIGLPAWWLLERGGVVGPVTIAVAFAAILISMLVQALVWAWLKFR